MAKIKLSQIDHVREAYNGLRRGFAWIDTAEGYDYWQGISCRLYRIARGEDLMKGAEPEPTPLFMFLGADAERL